MLWLEGAGAPTQESRHAFAGARGEVHLAIAVKIGGDERGFGSGRPLFQRFEPPIAPSQEDGESPGKDREVDLAVAIEVGGRQSSTGVEVVVRAHRQVRSS